MALSVTRLCGYEPKVTISATLALAFGAKLIPTVGAMPKSITAIKSVDRILLNVLFIILPPFVKSEASA